MKHYFLGTAAGYDLKKRLKMRFTRGDFNDYLSLQKYIKKRYSAPSVAVVRNGRSALAAGLKYAYADKDGKCEGEIIVNGFTCYAVYQGVKASGMTPVFADIDKKTLNFTTETLEKVVTKNTRAVIVQNTLGNMVDIKKIESFCKKHGLDLIEDLAHCAGRFYDDGREAGTVGKITILSFGKEKSIDVINGGAVALRWGAAPAMPNPSLSPLKKEARRARMYPTYGVRYRRLSYLGLAGLYMRILLKLGLVQKSADAEIDYDKHQLNFFQAKLALEELKKLTRASKPLREFYLVKNRNEVLKKLKKAGYYFDGFWYERPVSPERYYKKVHFDEGRCPVATEVSQKIINLPNYYSKKQLAKALKIIKEYVDE